MSIPFFRAISGRLELPEVSISSGASLDSTAFGKVHVCTGTAADYTVALPFPNNSSGRWIAFRMSPALTKWVTLDAGATPASKTGTVSISTGTGDTSLGYCSRTDATLIHAENTANASVGDTLVISNNETAVIAEVYSDHLVLVSPGVTTIGDNYPTFNKTRVIGVGTLFLSEYIIGSTITVNGVSRTVTWIGSNLAMAVSSPFTANASGQTATGDATDLLINGSRTRRYSSQDSVVLYCDGIAWSRIAAVPPATREVLTGARTYYVRTDGNDSNTGLADTAAGAFLTIQKAINVVAGNLDIGNYQVTIQVRAGTYTEALSMKDCITAVAPILIGDTSTPGNVIITQSSGTAVIQAYGGKNKWTIKGFKISATGTCVFGVVASQYAVLDLYEMEYSGATSAQVTGRHGGLIQMQANYTVSSGSAAHFSAFMGGVIVCTNRTVTITNTPAFSTAFAYADLTGVIQSSGSTFSGSPTGVRYSATNNGAIYTAGGGASYFPGNSSGTTANGGVYA